MKTHSIRLNGPWQFRATSAPGGRESSSLDHDRELHEGLIRLPADWPAFIAGHLDSCLAFFRSFNFPATLAENEICELCFAWLDAAASVSLNDSSITPVRDGHSAVFVITENLQSSNRLQIRFTQAVEDKQMVPFDGASLRIRQV